MANEPVDLGAIRGDWHFHARYVTNAIERTLSRAQKQWRVLKKKSGAAGEVTMDPALLAEFIEACRQTRALTDDLLLLQETQPAKGRKPAAPKRRRRSR